MQITRIGVDLAKRVFQLHGVDEHGAARICRALPRNKVRVYFAQLPPCLVGMEACASAHYWARELSKLGHTVKLMAAQFVAPYRKAKMMPTTRRRSAKQWGDPTCILWPPRPKSSKRC
jgi:transposase